MAIIETESLILKSYGLSEADKIVVFLSQNQGVLRGVAKGAKRLKSKFGGSLEPFSVVNLVYFQKEDSELVRIDQIELKKSFFANAVTPEFLQKFSYLSELLIEFAPPNEPNQRLYRMACVCLETAVENPQLLDNIGLYFELWVLRLGGFLPNWNKCEVCERELSSTETVNLQINFHLLCINCQKANGKWLISPIERKIFMLAQTLSPDKFLEATLNNPNEIKEISFILKRVISHILGKDIISDRILAIGN